MSKTNISTLIIDTQVLLSPALRHEQTCRPAITLVGTAQKYTEAENIAAQLSPDIIWLNLSIGHSDGIAEIRRLKELAPSSRILAITDKENEQEAFASIIAGAQGYRSGKTIDPEEIESLFQMLLQDECVIRPELLVPLMRRLRSAALFQPEHTPQLTQSKSKSREFAQLTTQERPIVQFISQGYRDSVIGTMLHLPKRAVRKLVQAILSKYGL